MMTLTWPPYVFSLPFLISFSSAMFHDWSETGLISHITHNSVRSLATVVIKIIRLFIMPLCMTSTERQEANFGRCKTYN